MQTTYILLKIDHTKELGLDFCDKVAHRAYTLDKVEDVTATLLVGGVYLEQKAQERSFYKAVIGPSYGFRYKDYKQEG